VTLQFYDRQSQPIDILQWCELNDDPKYTFVAHTWIIDPIVRVSTIWRGGPKSSFLRVLPIIFETIIFDHDDPVDIYSYPTEALAIAGHEDAVKVANERYLPAR
jgi:hypothetical protein